MKKYRYLMAVSLTGLCLLAGGVRLYRLGEMDTKGDEVWLMESARAGIGLVQYWNFHWSDFKTGRSMFLPRMAAFALIKAFGLEPDRFNVRLSYALVGILTIPALFLLGLRLGDERLAWILAFLGTINPYLLIYSRMAHIYAFPLLFNVLAAAFAISIIRTLQLAERPRGADLVWFVAASALACHSHMSSWPFIGLLWLPIFWLVIQRRQKILVRSAFRGLALAFAVWVLSILPWALVFISALFTAEESFLQGGIGPVSFGAMWRLPFVMTWGGGMPRAIITVGLLLAGIGLGLLNPRWRKVVGISLGLSLILFVGLALMMEKGGSFFNLRYFNPLWLTFILLSALGLLLLAEWIAALIQRLGLKQLKVGAAAAVLCAGVAAGMAAPIYWIIQLPGNPAPYSLINRWMDANLPPGTLVIVDRWFEPWNEMKYHAPTNVQLTFTIPNEPNEVLVKYNWTKTVQDFCAKYPETAYLELVKKSTVIGQLWEWPRRHFAQRQVFTNQYALELRRTLLASEESYYYADTNRIIVELFYNTRADQVAQARAAGNEILLCYGPGWGYAKPWQQFKDFRDWRVLNDQATLDLYNLTPQTNLVTLFLRGMALNGSKRVRFAQLVQADFQNLQLAELPIPHLPLRPGLNQFVLSDGFWPAAKIPLLLDRVEITKEEANNQTAEAK